MLNIGRVAGLVGMVMYALNLVSRIPACAFSETIFLGGLN